MSAMPATQAASASPASLASAATDAAGRYELAAPGPGMWRLRAEAPGRMSMEYALEPLLDGAEVPPVALARDSGLELRATDGAGRPLAARAVARPGGLFGSSPEDAEEWSNVPGMWQLAGRFAAAGPDGRLRLPRLAGERLRVIVAAPGRPPVTLEIGRRPPASVELPAGVPRTLRAADERGRPVAGALVWDATGRLPLGETDAEGRWTAAVPPRGTLELRLTGPAGQRGSARVSPPLETARARAGEAPPAAGPADLAVTLAPARRLAGRALDRATRQGVAGALVWQGGEASGFVRADRRGGYELAVPAGGAATLLAAAPGYLPVRASGGGGEAGEPGPTLLLPPAARLAGRVVDAAGRPVAGAEVQASPSLHELAASGVDFEGLVSDPAGLAARSDGNGRFRLRALSAGWTFDLACAKPGFATAVRKVRVPGPSISPPDVETVEIVLAAGRRGTGRVIDAEGRPVAGARVRSFVDLDRLPGAMEQDGQDELAMTSTLMIDSDDDGSRAPGPAAVSGADGRFALADLGEGAYDLKVSAAGFAPAEVPAVEVPAGAGEVDFGTVALAPGAAVEGRVVDAAGRPIAGAEVDVWAAADEVPGVSSDAEGRFTLGGLVPGRQLALAVNASGYVTRVLQDVIPPTREPRRVVLERGARLAGRVLDPDRRPVAGATVYLRSSPGSFSSEWVGSPPARTDEEGQFELTGVSPGTLELQTSARGFQVHRLSLEVHGGAERAGLEIVLAPGAVIAGRVLGPDGEPVAGARISAFDPGADTRWGGGAGGVADGEGRFRVEGVSTGPHVVRAEREGYPPASREIEVGPGENPVTLTFPAGRRISGRVVDERGNPVAGAVLTFQTQGEGGAFRATSGEDGSFSTGGVSPGLYLALAAKRGYVQSSIVPLAVGEEDASGVELRLAAATVTLTGRLLGLPPAELGKVQVHVLGEGGQRRGQVDRDGRYRVADLAPGSWFVLAVSGFDRQLQRELEIPPGASEASLDLDFAPEEGLELTGVALRGGVPLRGAALVLSGPAGSRFGSTDQEGGFRFDGLAAGRYRLDVHAIDGGLNFTREVDIDADRSVRLDFGAGRISGRVIEEPGGAPIAGAVVELREAAGPGASAVSGGLPGGVSSDSGGAFLVEATAGRWRVVATKPGYAAAETAVEVGAGEEVRGVELRLPSTEGITLEVALAAGPPPAEVRLAVLSPAGQVVSAGTFHVGEGGRVRVATVPAGSWELLVQAAGSATVSLPVTAPGPAGRVVLPPAGWLQIAVAPLIPATPPGTPADTGDIAATLTLTGPDGRPARILEWGGTLQPPPELRRGRAGVSGLAPGRWTATVTAADGRTWTGSAEVPPGGGAEISLR